MASKNACLALAAAALLTTACQSRPPWADGNLVTVERPQGRPAPTLDNLEARLLAAHNRERAAVGVPALVWDPALAASAAVYGPQLAAMGRLQHSPREGRAGQGENLWLGTRGAYTLEEMVGSWAGEKRIFRPGIFPNVSTSGNWSDVAHYTQMIWRGTTRVGCAVQRSAQWDFLICRYAPQGNVVGQPVP